jgi:four helix bundle protein
MKQHYKDLLVWQKAVTLVTRIYEITQCFPKEETYGLRSQIRRAAVSIPSNIAEGQARLNIKEFRQFLGVAKGSLAELDTQLVIAQNLGYLAGADLPIELLSEVRRMLQGLLSSLTTDN